MDHYAKRAGIDRHPNFTHGPQRDEDAVDAGTDASTTGPIQLIAVGFEPGVGFVGTIIEEIDRLQGHGVLRLVDLVVLTMDEDGSLTRVEIADEDFGDLLIADANSTPPVCSPCSKAVVSMCSRANEPRRWRSRLSLVRASP